MLRSSFVNLRSLIAFTFLEADTSFLTKISSSISGIASLGPLSDFFFQIFRSQTVDNLFAPHY